MRRTGLRLASRPRRPLAPMGAAIGGLLLLAGCAAQPAPGETAGHGADTGAPERSEERVPDIDVRAVDVERIVIPPGVCGDGSFGWDQQEPIALADGEGEAFDEDLNGASVFGIEPVGYFDFTGDGLEDIVVTITCSGSPAEMCCAGIGSIMTFIAVLDVSRDQDSPEQVGGTITSATIDSAPYLIDGDVELSGAAILSSQSPAYPDDQDMPAITVRNEFVDGEWTESWEPAG
ncbi:hypothetical protein [Gulosibacter sp. 10]|uniref:hypothetical protein n=1 Tax=Gulosibacter sp. 10 TaxID=1255570 RepID=UPI00097F4F84|nr:hypothetical protein [Gulosibacter sp. 10]SJM51403.1 hypothetical protein FM112_01950 [Gulosibacter sp. 10]